MHMSGFTGLRVGMHVSDRTVRIGLHILARTVGMVVLTRTAT